MVNQLFYTNEKKYSFVKICIPIIFTELIVVVFIQLNEKNDVIRKIFKSQKIKDNSLKTILNKIVGKQYNLILEHLIPLSSLT